MTASSLNFIVFRLPSGVVDRTKAIPRKAWNPEKKIWSIPYREDYKAFLSDHFKTVATCVFPNDAKTESHLQAEISQEKINPRHKNTHPEKPASSAKPVPQPYLDYLIKKRYSRNTVRNYCSQLVRFLDYSGKDENEISEIDASDYMLFLAKNENYSSSYQKIAIHAIRCYFEHVLHKPVSSESLTYPKSEKKLPIVNGVDLRYIQELLGHENPKTTEIYTHVTRSSLQKIKSPLDSLDL